MEESPTWKADRPRLRLQVPVGEGALEASSRSRGKGYSQKGPLRRARDFGDQVISPSRSACLVKDADTLRGVLRK